MNNSESRYNPDLTDNECDQQLDRYFAAVEKPQVDISGIALLTHMKVLQYGLMRSRRRWRLLTIAATAACVAMIVAFAFIYRAASETDPLYAEANSTDCVFTEMEIPTGQRMTFILPDGTKMTANSRSKVRYPNRFVGNTRTVWAYGEVYFDVAKDAGKPFIVMAEGFNVKVFGTQFNISNYDRKAASIVLVEGSVAVSTDADEFVRMKPGHMVTVANGSIESLRSVDATRHTGWVNGSLALDDLTLSDVAKRLEQYYGVDVDVAPSLLNDRLYGSLDMKTQISDIIDVLTAIIPMNAQYDANHNRYRLTPKN